MTYFEKLDTPSQKRYLEKITEIGGIDPFVVDENSFCFEGGVSERCECS